MKHVLRGLVAAPFTPFKTDMSIDLDRVRILAAALVEQRVSGTFICGTTGEGASLTMDERKMVATTWRRAAPPSLALIVHVGHNCLADSRELARHAASIGADAIATIAPTFFRPDGIGGLVTFCAEIAAAAPDLPFYYYHMPSITGFHCSMAKFLERAADCIPNLAGVKFTHDDLIDFALARTAAGGRVNVLFGRDEALLAGLALGAQGAVGSTYNYAAGLYHEITAAFQRGDLEEARRLQYKATLFISAFDAFGGGVRAGKAMMKMCGLDCGGVRLPLGTLAGEQYHALERVLRDQGFFDYAFDFRPLVGTGKAGDGQPTHSQ